MIFQLGRTLIRLAFWDDPSGGGCKGQEWKLREEVAGGEGSWA